MTRDESYDILRCHELFQIVAILICMKTTLSHALDHTIFSYKIITLGL